MHKLRENSMSPLVATIIIVAVSIALSIAITLWIEGIIGITGFGSRVIRIVTYGDMEVKGIEVGSQFRLFLKNLGGDPIYIDMILIDSKYKAIFVSARNSEGESRLVEDRTVIMIYPGETVEIYGIVKGVKLAPATVHEITIHTALGLQYTRPIRAEYCGIGIGLGNETNRGAYCTGVKRGDGKIACILVDTIKNRLRKKLVNGRIEVYVWEEEQPIYMESLPLDLAEINPEEQVTLKLYFGIPPGYEDQPLIVHLIYDVEGGGEREEFAYYMDPPQPIYIYILWLGEDTPGSWVDPTIMKSIAQSIIDPGHVIMIDSSQKLYEFFKDPPEGAIIINCHGEGLPAPTKDDILNDTDSYISDIYDEGHDPDNTGDHVPVYIPRYWKIWFRYVSSKINEKGLIFTHAVGIFGWYLITTPDSTNPTYSHYDWRPSIVYTGSCCGDNGRFHRDGRWTGTAIERNGLKEFLNISTITYTTYPVHGEAEKRSNDLEDLEKLFLITFPEKVGDTGSGWTSWRSLNEAPNLVFWFYSTENIAADFPYASIAIKVGNGFFIHNAWPPASVLYTENPSWDANQFISYAAIYFSVYIYIKHYVLGDI